MTTNQRSKLKAIAARQKASTNIGKNGVTDNLIAEVDRSLYHNELVKLALLKNCEGDMEEIIVKLTQATASQCVQKVGGKFVLYRLSDKEGIEHLL